MKPDKLKLILFSLSAFIFWSCSSEPADFGEQYKKTLYIVNSRDMVNMRMEVKTIPCHFQFIAPLPNLSSPT